MEQRINDKFEEGIGKLERMMLDMNQSRRRSPIRNQRGNSVSSSASERRRISPQSDRERRESLDSRRRERDDHGNRDYRYDDERRNRREETHGRRNVDGRDRHRYASDFDSDVERGSVRSRHHGHEQSQLRSSEIQSRVWESGMKTEIPEFKGGMQAEEFLDWLANVEEIFDFKEVPEDRRVKLVATRLRGRALAWWQQTKLTRERMGKSKVVSWEKMKKMMRATFLPYNFQSLMYQRLQNLRQGTRTVNDYADEFYQLIARNDIMETEAQLTARYIGGLRTQIQDMVNMFSPMSVAEAHQKALTWEKQGRRGGGVFTNSNIQSKGTNGSSSVSKAVARPVVHEVAKAKTDTKLKCFNCQEVGHKSNECTKPKKRAMIAEECNEDVEEVEADYTNPPKFDEEEEFVSGDEGYSLMMRRSCLTPKQEEETSWLRSNIFQSTCTILGKVCKFVIDAWSCDNIISTEAVKKLALKTEKHPKPYKLAWLRKGGEVKVSRRACVTFSIGKTYKDEIWCDVVDMDVCHLLLGATMAIR